MDIFILTFASIAIITSFGILFITIYRRRQYPINTSKILVCNTYLAIILSSVILLNMYGCNLYGISHEGAITDRWWCYGLAYLLHVGICSLYFSCLVQAIFRLFRVVLYKYKQLQTFQFISRLIIIQWLMAILLMTLPLFLKYFKYQSELYQCQIPFTHFQGVMVISLIVFFGPINIIAMIYCYIVYYIKYRTTLLPQHNRQRSNQRDLIVLRRISIFVAILCILSLPTIILWLIYLITGYLHPLIHHIEWLIYSISMLILSIALILLSPELQQLVSNIWTRNHRIQPVVINEPNSPAAPA